MPKKCLCVKSTVVAMLAVFATNSGAQLSTDFSELLEFEPTITDSPHARAGEAVAAGDFDNDGKTDMVIVAPGSGLDFALGGATIFWGREDPANNPATFTEPVQILTTDFGEVFPEVAATSADFNLDGRDDFVLGAPHQGDMFNEGFPSRAGWVYVIRTPETRNDIEGEVFTQNDLLEAPAAAEGNMFGHALAAGDFNCDARPDLAIGIPGQNVGGISGAGAVAVVYGTDDAQGLGLTSDQFWHQDAAGIPGSAEEGDAFAWSLAAGDFDTNGCDDLAVGVRNESIGDEFLAGAVNVIYGSLDGLTSENAQLWSQDSDGIPGQAELVDQFGSSLVVGDFNGDGADDLAVGARQEAIGEVADAGAVIVIYGASSFGLVSAGSQFFSQATMDIGGEPEQYDYFGAALTAGDFAEDGADDLVIGVPGEDLSTGDVQNGGLIHILQGRPASGITTQTSQIFTQNTSGIAGMPGTNNEFGFALAAGDFDGNAKADLIVGVPGAQDGTDAGSAIVLFGRESSSADITASQTLVEPNTQVTLNWTSLGISCSGSWTGLSLDANGSDVVTVAHDTAYELTCTGALGQIIKDSVLVRTLALPVTNLQSQFMQVPEGDPVQLEWESNHAERCEPSWEGGVFGAIGQDDPVILGDTTYTITCSNALGSDAASVQVSVIPDPDITLTSSDSLVAPGSSFTITWTTMHADSCSAPWANPPVGINGSAQIDVPEDAAINTYDSYSITCRNATGISSATVLVAVIAAEDLGELLFFSSFE